MSSVAETTAEIPAAAGFTRPYNRRARAADFLAKSFCTASALMAILSLFLIFGYVLYKGITSIDLNFFTMLPAPPGEAGGMRNALAGTLVLVAMASCIGVPVGMLCGIYLAEYAKKGWFSGTIRLIVDVLAGTPSIIVGVLGYEILVVKWDVIGVIEHPAFWGSVGNFFIWALNGLIYARNTWFPTSFSAWAGAIALGFMMCPIVARTTEEILRLVPAAYREASVGVGATRFQTLFRVVLPSAKSGIITGVMLAVARVAGETAPLLFTVLGYDESIFAFNGTFPFVHCELNHAFPSLTVMVYKYATSGQDSWIRQAWAGMLILIVVVFSLNIAVRWASRAKQGSGRGR